METRKKVLIVDDEPHLVKSLSFVLSKEGYEVSSASDGEEALQKIRHSRPALIFLDIMMPKKNGYEVCQEIRNSPELKDIYIIMLTAKGQAADREEGLGIGANDFITKPFSALDVLARVRNLLEQQ